MRLLGTATILFFVVSHVVLADKLNVTESVDEIRNVQDDRFKAMIVADRDGLERILSQSLVYTHTTGQSESKIEFIDSVTSRKISYDSIEPIDVLVRIYGDTAVATGTAAMKVSAGDRRAEFSIRFIEVYHRVDRDWQLVSWQSTRLPDESD